MTKFTSAFLFLIFSATGVYAQNGSLKGTIQEATTNAPVRGASVVIFLEKDSAKNEIKSTVTDAAGNFELNDLPKDSFLIAVSSIGYQQLIRPVIIGDSVKNLGVLHFTRQGKDLSDVTIISKAPPVAQKGDTTQYSASQYKVNPDATTEDLIKKMPGITVDKDGTVTAHGEQVKKVTIDGKDFFGDDASAALKNLPSEVVDKIQVFDRLSDQAQLTGFDDGNSVKAINVVTKSGIKNGQFGRIYGGYGTDDHYAAGGNISFFNGNRRISLVGNFNNINQQNFGSQDLLGVTSSGGGRGGGGRGGGNTDNFSVGQSPGISKTNAIGINYSNVIDKKVTITGSYFFNNSNNSNESVVNTETFSSPKNLFSTQQSNSIANNNNHRINMRLEYKIDSSNSLFIIPSLNYQNYNSSGLTSLQNFYGAGDSLNTSINRNTAEREGFNIRNNIMFRHSFAKKGRTLSLGFNTNYTKNDGNSVTNAQYRFFNDAAIVDSLQQQLYDNNTNGHTIGGNIAYTEPIGKIGILQVDYTPSVQKNKADQQTFSFDGQKYSMFDSTLSNKFDNTITTNNAGLNYRRSKNRDEQLSFGVNFQNARLESQRIFPIVSSVNQTFSDILPNAMWRKKFSASSNIRVFYRASTNFPSVNQLQDVVNLSNPLRVSAGNPALKESYTNLLSGRYTYTNSKTSRSFIANVFLQTASNYISNAIYIAQQDTVIQQGIQLKKGSQLTKPVNLDGYKSLRTFLTYSMPINPIKTNINLNAGFSYSRLPGLNNYTASITNNYAYNTGVVLASNISEYVDFNLSYNASFNNAQTTSTFASTNNYVNQTAGFQLNLLDKKGWFVRNDITGQSYSGLSAGLNQHFWLWNAAIGKKFLKKQAGELKLSVFDLLKQNQSIVRTVTGAYIEDAQSQVLQQYFMLTFTYSLRNFGVAAKSFNGEFRGREGMNRPVGRNPSF
ncbi:outer membrane beta-barrel protein [Ferruginibacter paludis]|uniref:outer membrane beta-barrel protein n=1 Tax=Ferruginibacter paludis TaxID=1310417 RepID=UPI0025B2FD15|nr:outer membrane beta-barrel protein [Ferruginibacter paludis]MDN3658226.1 outer membrane beta-barrel protein [Ferruginibacter paludis]